MNISKDSKLLEGHPSRNTGTQGFCNGFFSSKLFGQMARRFCRLDKSRPLRRDQQPASKSLWMSRQYSLNSLNLNDIYAHGDHR
jgi:hypothetical protein